MHKALYKIYMILRKPLEGRGLSRIPILRKINDWIAWSFFGRNIPEYIIIEGDRFYLDGEDAAHIRFTVYSSPYIIEEIKKLRKGDIFIDVGANMGYFSFWAEKQGAKVYSIEPSPTALKFLRKNVKNSEIIEKAITNYSGNIILYEPSQNLGGSSVVHKAEIEHTVACDKLDNIIREQVIDLIKIDIEDSEGAAFDGMVNTLKKSKKIIIECRNPDILKKIGDLGFDMKQLYRDDYLFVREN